jgi:hypothetical protein
VELGIATLVSPDYPITGFHTCHSQVYPVQERRLGGWWKVGWWIGEECPDTLHFPPAALVDH